MAEVTTMDKMSSYMAGFKKAQKKKGKKKPVPKKK